MAWVIYVSDSRRFISSSSEESMASASMSEAVFLESADSVRFSFDAYREFPIRKRHLEMEMVLALLFGERIGVTGAYSFDSSGFLEVAAQLVRKGRDQRGVGRRPILLGLLPGMGTFREYVARQIGRPKEEFFLSGWPSITDDQALRNDFAHLILTPDPDPSSITQLLRRTYEQERVEDLLDLASYFDQSTVTVAAIPKIRLESYVDGLLGLPLDSFHTVTRDAAAVIVEGIRTLRERGVLLDNRSDIRVRKSEIEQWTGQDVYDGMLEFVDTCYNQVLHDSLGTRAGVFSSRITDSRGLGMVGEGLAYRVRDTLLGKVGKPGRSQLSLKIAPDETLVPKGAFVDEKLREADSVEWKDVLELIDTRDFDINIKRLKLAQFNGQRGAAERLLLKHIELVEPVVRPYRLTPTESGIKLALLQEYKVNPAKAYIGVVTGLAIAASSPLLEYAISSQTSIDGLGFGVGVALGIVQGVLRSSDPVPKEQSARMITGTVETLKGSVGIE
jgi:hypothetical protein